VAFFLFSSIYLKRKWDVISEGLNEYARPDLEFLQCVLVNRELVPVNRQLVPVNRELVPVNRQLVTYDHCLLIRVEATMSVEAQVGHNTTTGCFLSISHLVYVYVSSKNRLICGKNTTKEFRLFAFLTESEKDGF